MKKTTRNDMEALGTEGHWLVFGVAVVVLLGIDMWGHRKAHRPSLGESVAWTLFWIGLSLCFNAYVWMDEGREKALEFFTAYLLEKSLSVDNLFVFALIFGYFGIKVMYQHSVLFWGIIGALVMRAVFIYVGASLLVQFEWMMTIFGAFLLYSGGKMLWGVFRKTDETIDPGQNIAVRWMRKIMPVAQEDHGGKFVAREGGRTVITALLLCLVCIEVSDLIFAVDSIPAVLSVSTDMYIVYTSNIFAILGLRSLYFALLGVMDKMTYLKPALGAILGFIGLKMVWNYLNGEYFGHDAWDIGNLASLGVIVGALVAAGVAQRVKNRRVAG